MRFKTAGEACCSGRIEIFADIVVAGDRVEQAIGDAVGVGVEEAEPAQAVDLCERVEELGEAVLRPRSSP